MMHAPARIVGLGAICALGAGVEALWQGALAGRAGWDRPISRDPWRVFDLARAASQEAISDAGWASMSEVGLVVASAKAGIALGQHVMDGAMSPEALVDFPLHRLASTLARELGVCGPVITVSVACASGTSALGYGLRLIRMGRAQRVLVVGADALTDFVQTGFGTLRALSRGEARPFDRRRDGLRLGEAGAAIALEAGRGPSRAVLAGFGGANDANHITGPARDGRGLVLAVEAALKDSGRTMADVDAISAHGTATRYNDAMEGQAFSRLSPGRRIPVQGIKGAVGHTLGAAGVLEGVLSVRGLEEGLWPPTAGLEELDPEIPLDVVTGEARALPLEVVLSSSSGFSGINAAVVLCRS